MLFLLCTLMWPIFVCFFYVTDLSFINNSEKVDVSSFTPSSFIYENADLLYDVIRMRQLSKQTLHELSPNDNS